jgi:peptide/nickel transport system substrate-binding protein
VKRWLIRPAGAGLVIAVVVATALTVFTGAAAGRPGGAAAPAGTLVVARAADLDMLDPHKAPTFAALQTLPLVYESLTRLDKNLAVQPGLATSWSFSNGGKTLTLHLRTGVKFGNGQAFTSADVKASLGRILNPATGAIAASNLAAILHVLTPDAQTVVLKLRYADAPILAALADMNTAILSKTDIAAKTIAKKANGTGPFRIVAWTPGQFVNLVRNSHYWGGAPKLAGIDFRAIPTETSVAAAVSAGTADIGIVTNPVVAKTVGGSAHVVRQPTIDYHVLMLNGRSGPLKDQRVRLAIACTIDRKQVLATAALNEGKVAGPITSPAFLSNPNDRPCPTPDLAKAKSLLSAAGYASGLSLDTIVETGEYATATAEAQNVQAQLKQVGINLKLEVLDTNTYVQRWLDETFDAAFAFNTGRADPDTQYGRYFQSTGSLNKQGGYASPALDALFARGRATSDYAARKAIYKKLSETLENQAVWVWLFVGYNYYVVNSRVHGFVSTPNGSLQYLRSTTVS